MIKDCPVSVAVETSVHTNDYTVLIEHDIIPNCRLILSRDEFKAFTEAPIKEAVLALVRKSWRER